MFACGAFTDYSFLCNVSAKGVSKARGVFESRRRCGGRPVRGCTVEHFSSVRAVLWVQPSHGQPGDHDKHASQNQQRRQQVFTLKPASRGEF